MLVQNNVIALILLPFMFRREYPEYYELIKCPMDLDTLREKVALCSTIDEFIASARLIWENCSKFNDPGADIVGLANKLSVFVRDAVVVTSYNVLTEITFFSALYNILLSGKVWW
jgi:histone acetyltransferase